MWFYHRRLDVKPLFCNSTKLMWQTVGIAFNVDTEFLGLFPWAPKVQTPSGPRKSGIPKGIVNYAFILKILRTCWGGNTGSCECCKMIAFFNPPRQAFNFFDHFFLGIEDLSNSLGVFMGSICHFDVLCLVCIVIEMNSLWRKQFKWFRLSNKIKTCIIIVPKFSINWNVTNAI